MFHRLLTVSEFSCCLHDNAHVFSGYSDLFCVPPVSRVLLYYITTSIFPNFIKSLINLVFFSLCCNFCTFQSLRNSRAPKTLFVWLRDSYHTKKHFTRLALTVNYLLNKKKRIGVSLFDFFWVIFLILFNLKIILLKSPNTK